MEIGDFGFTLLIVIGFAFTYLEYKRVVVTKELVKLIGDIDNVAAGIGERMMKLAAQKEDREWKKLVDVLDKLDPEWRGEAATPGAAAAQAVARLAKKTGV